MMDRFSLCSLEKLSSGAVRRSHMDFPGGGRERRVWSARVKGHTVPVAMKEYPVVHLDVLWLNQLFK